METFTYHFEPSILFMINNINPLNYFTTGP